MEQTVGKFTEEAKGASRKKKEQKKMKANYGEGGKALGSARIKLIHQTHFHG